MLDERDRDGMVDAVAADGTRDVLRRQLTDAAERAVGGGVTASTVRLQRQVPLGYRIDAYTAFSATVSVWAVNVLDLGERAALGATWATTVVELTWERDDWRLVGFATEPGPVPEPQGDGEVEHTVQAIRRFTEYSHAAQ